MHVFPPVLPKTNVSTALAEEWAASTRIPGTARASCLLPSPYPPCNPGEGREGKKSGDTPAVPRLSRIKTKGIDTTPGRG
jgi:hypothetical protein